MNNYSMDSNNSQLGSTLITNFHDSVEVVYKEQPKTIFERIYRRLTTWSVSKADKKISTDFFKVTALASNILSQLPEDWRHVGTLREKLTSDFQSYEYGNFAVTKRQLEQFCTDMDKIFKEIYPLVEINPFNLDNKMPKQIQDYYSSEIAELRQQKRDNPQIIINEDYVYAKKQAKAKFAIDLGAGISRNKGTTGTLIIRDINGKEVGIYKVSRKDVPLWTKIKTFFRALFGGQVSYLSNSELAQPQAEGASYLVSKNLDFNLAPATKKGNLMNPDGVFQVFIRREKGQGILKDILEAKSLIDEHKASFPPKFEMAYKEAKEVLKTLEAKTTFTDAEKTKFQKLAIFDYLIGNLDRHEENWLVTLTKDNEIMHIKAIDNANAFPRVQPEKGSVAAKQQYRWKFLQIAQQKFTKETLNFIYENITKDKILGIIESIKEEFPKFLDEEMERLFLLRAGMIIHFINSNKTPANLAEYSTEDEMYEYLRNSQTAM